MNLQALFKLGEVTGKELSKKVSAAKSKPKPKVTAAKAEAKPSENLFAKLIPNIKKAHAQEGVVDPSKFQLDEETGEPIQGSTIAEKPAVSDIDKVLMEGGFDPTLLKKTQPQTKSISELLAERDQEMAAMPKPAAKPQQQDDFLGRLWQNTVNAPAGVIGAMGDVLSGKAGADVDKAYNKLNQDMSEGKVDIKTMGKTAFGDNIVGQLADTAFGGAQLLGNIGLGGLEGVGNLADFGTETLLGGNEALSIGKKIIKPTVSAARGLSSLATGVKQNDLPSQLTSFTGQMAAGSGAANIALKGATKLVSSIPQLANIANKSKNLFEITGWGSKLKAGGVMSGNVIATKNPANIANIGTKALNTAEKFLKTFVKNTPKNATQALFSDPATGRDITPETLTAGIIVGNLLDGIGGTLIRSAGKQYSKAVDGFVGESGSAESLKTAQQKSLLALEEGYTGGRDPESYIELAQNNINNYSQRVTQELAKDSTDYSKQFIEGIKNKIDEIRIKDPADAAIMDKTFERLIGETAKEQVQTLSTSLKNEINALSSMQAALEAAKKQAGKNFNPTKYGQLITNIEKKATEQIPALRKSLEIAQKEAAATGAQPFTLLKIKEIMSTAAEKNAAIVSGQAAASAKDAAANKLYLLARDEGSEFINKAFPQIKDINDRLNVAYRIKSALTPVAKKGDIIKRGTKRQSAKYQTGKAIKSNATKYGARGLADLVNFGQKGIQGIPQDIVNMGTGAVMAGQNALGSLLGNNNNK